MGSSLNSVEQQTHIACHSCCASKKFLDGLIESETKSGFCVKCHVWHRFAFQRGAENVMIQCSDISILVQVVFLPQELECHIVLFGRSFCVFCLDWCCCGPPSICVSWDLASFLPVETVKWKTALQRLISWFYASAGSRNVLSNLASRASTLNLKTFSFGYVSAFSTLASPVSSKVILAPLQKLILR